MSGYYHMEVTDKTRIRKLPSSITSHICSILDASDDWKKFTAHIPNSMGRPGCLYNIEQLGQFAQAGQQRGESSTKEVLKDWGTRNTTVRQLINVLQHPDVNLIRVADYLERLIDPTWQPPSRTEILYNRVDYNFEFTGIGSGAECFAPPPMEGSPGTARVPPMAGSGDERMSVGSEDDIKSDEVRSFPYTELQNITENFSDTRSIGCGGYSKVYLGLSNGERLAVKRLFVDSDEIKQITKQFQTEFDVLTKFKHKNLLPIIGLSSDGPHFCIVYPYMENGSLEDRLACKNNTDPLTWQTRIRIAQETCEGIYFLHTANEKPLVHRDIKSANILLDKDFVAKLGDFGLARQGPANKTAVHTTAVIGTSAYMASEAIHGTITDKLDSFSYGVVLLELVTGLPAFDEHREEKALIGHVEEQFEWDVEKCVDKTAGEWDMVTAQKIMNYAQKCTEFRHKNRVKISEILHDIMAL